MESITTTFLDVQELLSLLHKVALSGLENSIQRAAVIDALRETLACLETPWETAFRIICTQPAQAAALKVCHDVQLFCHWTERFPDVAVKDTELCELFNGDPELLIRMLRHLGATKIIKQTQAGYYSLTQFSRALGSSNMASIVPFLYNTAIPGFTNLPKFLELTHYCTPNTSDRTNWHHMRGISRFDDLKRDSADMQCFQAVMQLNAANKLSLTDLVPIDDLLPTHKLGSALLVDVGGGFGHDIVRFQNALLERQIQLHPGSLVLQDIAQEIEDADFRSTGNLITTMKHDFFDEQPVKGALIYYLHTVLHDWTDGDAVKILSQLARAAESDYSRILIHETVLLADKPSVSSTSQDMQMMMALSSRERTEDEWYNIITQADLVVQKIWSSPGEMESVLEARKP